MIITGFILKNISEMSYFFNIIWWTDIYWFSIIGSFISIFVTSQTLLLSLVMPNISIVTFTFCTSQILVTGPWQIHRFHQRICQPVLKETSHILLTHRLKHRMRDYSGLNILYDTEWNNFWNPWWTNTRAHTHTQSDVQCSRCANRCLKLPCLPHSNLGLDSISINLPFTAHITIVHALLQTSAVMPWNHCHHIETDT